MMFTAYRHHACARVDFVILALSLLMTANGFTIRRYSSSFLSIPKDAHASSVVRNVCQSQQCYNTRAFSLHASPSNNQGRPSSSTTPRTSKGKTTAKRSSNSPKSTKRNKPRSHKIRDTMQSERYSSSTNLDSTDRYSNTERRAKPTINSEPFDATINQERLTTAQIQCEHFSECSGCLVDHNVAKVPIIQSAQLFFSSVYTPTMSSSSLSALSNQKQSNTRQSNKGSLFKSNAASSSLYGANQARSKQDDQAAWSRAFAPNHLDNESDNPFPLVVPTPVTGWRTQAKLVAVPPEGSSSKWGALGCTFGLYQSKSHTVMRIPRCAVHHPAINKAVAMLEEATRKMSISAYAEASREGQLRYVQLQVERMTNQVSLTLIWNAAHIKEAQPALSRLCKTLLALDASGDGTGGRLWHSIWLHCNDSVGNAIFLSRVANRWSRLHGPEYMREPISVPTVASVSSTGDTRLAAGEVQAQTTYGYLYFSPLTFRQGNLDGFDKIAMAVAQAIPGGSTVCEMYAGVGVLGLTALAYHHVQGEPLVWLRCSDENPANPRCFQQAVQSLPIDMTGRVPRDNRGGYSRSKRGVSAGDDDDDDDEGTMTLADYRKQVEKGASDSSAPSKRGPKTTYLVSSAGKAVYMGQALGAQVLVVDPPRKGLDDELLQELCKPVNQNQPYAETEDLLMMEDGKINWTNDVQRLVYVSCGFDALARE
jgi:hypothetical protein